MKKHIETSVLREEYRAIIKKIEQIEDYNDEVRALEKRASEIHEILIQRYRAAIYKAACEVLDNRGCNQFYMAAKFADGAIDGSEIFPDSTDYEIGSYYTKKGYGAYVVYFD